jgi:hypothetical protein
MARGFKTGGGSRKGKPNKLTRDIKEMIVTALNLEGGVEYLRERARDNPAAFLALVGCAMPLQVNAGDGGPVLIVTGILRPGDLEAAAQEQDQRPAIDVTPSSSKLH